jgi:hypothetical protein
LTAKTLAGVKLPPGQKDVITRPGGLWIEKFEKATARVSFYQYAIGIDNTA